ncbi:hypothetical protein G3M58_65395 [Streptomyces sp. SID7499]|uniref:Uncharacterized protein n=1 Tax=Streptomyces sp. SID7499 TaxID=2706086 RepID=A0A6G3XIE5_9ACTN|nr:hypothetical protein [Streptomyces sp. SID7499]
MRCTTSSTLAQERIVDRARSSAHRSAHADQEFLDAISEGKFSYDRFKPISLSVPTLTVDTSNGYQPSVQYIGDFLKHSE